LTVNLQLRRCSPGDSGGIVIHESGRIASVAKSKPCPYLQQWSVVKGRSWSEVGPRKSRLHSAV